MVYDPDRYNPFRLRFVDRIIEAGIDGAVEGGVERAIATAAAATVGEAVGAGIALYEGYKLGKSIYQGVKKLKRKHPDDIPETDSEDEHHMGWFGKKKAKSHTSSIPGSGAEMTGETFVKARRARPNYRAKRRGRRAAKKGKMMDVALSVKCLPDLMYCKANRYIAYLSEADFESGRILMPSLLHSTVTKHYLPCHLYELTTMPGYEGYSSLSDHKWGLVWDYSNAVGAYGWERDAIPAYEYGGGGDLGAAANGATSAPIETTNTNVSLCGAPTSNRFQWRMHCKQATPEMLRAKDAGYLRDCTVDLQFYPCATHDVTWRVDLVMLNDERVDPETYNPTIGNTVSKEELQPAFEGLIKPFTQSGSMLPTFSKPDKVYKFLKTWKFKVKEAVVDSTGGVTAAPTHGQDKVNSLRTRIKIPINRIITNKQFRTGITSAAAGTDTNLFNQLGPEAGFRGSRLDGDIYAPYTQITGAANTDQYVVDATGRPVGSKRARLYLMIRANVEATGGSVSALGTAIAKLRYPSYNMICTNRWLFDKRSEGAVVTGGVVMD